MGVPDRQIMSLLGEAVEHRSPQDRAAFLDGACAGDAGLRAQAEELLRAYEAAGNFLQGDRPYPDLIETAAEPMPERPGTAIGPYRLLEQLGEGGFGVVFLAEQREPVRRRVALKVLKPGMDSRQVVARFEAERQALALMDHPHIAKVFDGGETATGRPYFVMELVKGAPLTAFCDQYHLPIRERLGLFVSVCRAVQHAHQKGVIHRDLKPSNVLVTLHDTTPVPKVIDFGVAKALGQELTDKTLFTGVAQMVGTPLYMSPEQAGQSSLDIDTRSDIYSLGVLLYELLTGTTPFDKERLRKAGYDELRRIIREEEPARPSTRFSTLGQAGTAVCATRKSEPAKLSQLVRGELDWIVMKTLEKDRNRRYDTANGFAADVQRYLNDEPVQACPPSARYRLAKFIRRYKAPVTAAAMVFLVLIVGVIGTTLGLIRAVEAEHQERNAKLEAVQAKQEAERNLGQAIKAADTFFTRVSESTLLDKPALQPFRKELLEEAQKHYLELFNKKKDDPILKAELGASYIRMVIVLAGLDAGPEALQALEKGLALVEPLVRADPGNADLAKRLSGICKAERAFYRGWSGGLGRISMVDQLPVVERACALWKQLAQDHRHIPELQADYATLLLYRGDIHNQQGQMPACLRLYQGADNIFSRLLREGPLSPDYRINAALARAGVAYLLVAQGSRQQGITAARAAMAMAESLAREFPEKPIVTLLLMARCLDLADYLADCPQEAEALLDRGLQVGVNLLAAEPDAPGHFFSLSELYSHRGALRERARRFSEAEADFRAAREVAEKAISRSPAIAHFQAALSANRLAQLLSGQKRFAQADTAFQEADTAFREARFAWEKLTAEFHRPDHRAELGSTLLNWACSCKARGRLKEAEKLFRQAALEFETLQTDFPARSRWAIHELGYIHLFHGEVLAGLGNRDEDAEKAYRQSLAFHEKQLAQDPESAEYQERLTWSYAALARLLRKVGKRLQASRLDGKRIALVKKPASGATLASEMNNVAWNLAADPDPQLRDPGLAVELARKAVELAPLQGSYWNTLGVAHYRAADWKAAVEALTKSMELLKGGDSVQWFFVAMTRWKLDQKEEARRWFDRSVSWMEKNQPTNEGLRRFRAEAAELLGVREKKE